MSENRRISYEEGAAGLRIAYLQDGPKDETGRCGLFWLGGFKSEMTGTKATALAELADRTGRPCLRFDYSGHGASAGDFTEGTISAWLEQSLHMFRRHTRGPQVVVGSSMGGWLAMLMLKALGAEAARIGGLVLIAPAVDMTEVLMWNTFPAAAREAVMRQGLWLRPSAYSEEPYPITRKLIEDGRRHLLFGRSFAVDCPVRILEGDADVDVPLAHVTRVFETIAGDDVTLTLVKGGDHRLSTPKDIALLKNTMRDLAERCDR